MSDFEGQQIEKSLDLERIDEGLYRSVQLWKPINGRGVFGGHTISLAANAATRSVESRLHLHSLHSYFLSFGNVDLPIIFHVDALRDGKSYATRSVKAVQNGKAIFVLLASFQVPEPRQPVFQVDFDMASIPPPEECVPTEEKLRLALEDKHVEMSRKMREWLERTLQERKASAIEIRGTDSMEGLADGLASQVFWFRSRALVRKDAFFQKLVLAYASDLRFIGTVGKALGLGPKTEPRLGMMASLDHSMFFYENDIDVSEWMVYYMESPRAGSGRGVVIGKIYTRDGRLAVVCTQEGVVRAEEPKSARGAKL